MRVPKCVIWKREVETYMNLCKKYAMMRLERKNLMALSSYCCVVSIPYSTDETTVREFANELFHGLGVLAKKFNIGFGEVRKCCGLFKDDTDKCYYAAFNHHRIVKLPRGRVGYSYSVLACSGSTTGISDGSWVRCWLR